MKGILRFSFLLLVCLLFAGNASANLIVNGSFENGDFSPVNGGSWVTVEPGMTNITGWTVGGDGVDWHNSTEFTPILFGDKAVDLNQGSGDSGSIAQTFSTTIGQWYNLSFWLAGPDPGGFPDPRAVGVSMAGESTEFSQPASPNTALSWGEKTLDFLAVDATTTLTFSTVNSYGYWGPVIDNVSVNAIPEPATILLLGAGLMGLSGTRRQYRR